MIKKIAFLSLVSLTLYPSQEYSVGKFFSNLISGRAEIIAHDYTPLYQNGDSAQWLLGETCKPVYNLNPKKILDLTGFFRLWVQTYNKIDRSQPYTKGEILELDGKLETIIKSLEVPSESIMKNEDKATSINFDKTAKEYGDLKSRERSERKKTGCHRDYYDVPHYILDSFNYLKNNALNNRNINNQAFSLKSYVITNGNSKFYEGVHIADIAQGSLSLPGDEISGNTLFCTHWIKPGTHYEVEEKFNPERKVVLTGLAISALLAFYKFASHKKAD